MDIYVGSRGSGKTAKLIKMSAAGQGIIVAGTQEQCSYIKDTATRMGLDIPFPICFREFISIAKNHYPGTTWLIDNLDLCLKSIQVTAATVNLDSVEAMNGVQIMYR